jgi:hypothetical protein
MTFSKRKALGAGVLSAVAFAAGGQAMADTTPLDLTGNGSILTMENDGDTYTPTNTNPYGDGVQSTPTPGPGVAPGAQAADNTRTDGLNDTLRDVHDRRSGTARRGFLEEVPTGFQNKDGQVVNSGDGSAHFAIYQPQGTTAEASANAFGAVVRVGADFDGIAGVNNDDPFTIGEYSAKMDVYLDPAIADEGGDAIQWQAGLNSPGGTYHQAMGIYIDSNGDGTFDLVNQIGGVLADNIAAGQWVRLEIRPIDAGGDDLRWDTRAWDMTGGLIGQSIVDSAAIDGQTASGVGGPSYAAWFLDNTLDYIFIDNLGWSAALTVPEPTSVVLIGLGAAAVMGRRRRQA